MIELNPRKIRETSIAAYNEIKNNGLLSKRRMEIYDIVFHHGPMTSNETFDYSILKGLDGYRHNANARMTELRGLGVVQEIGTRKCKKTGKTVILWDVTEDLPVKKKPVKKNKSQLRSMLLALDEKMFDIELKSDLRNIIKYIE